MPRNKKISDSGTQYELIGHLDFKTPVMPRIGAAAITLMDLIPKGIANTPFGWMAGARYITPPEYQASQVDDHEL